MGHIANTLSPLEWLAAGSLLAVTAYVSGVAFSWYRYGRIRRPADGGERDPQLDLFLPDYEVVERHTVRVAAPAETTFAAACSLNLLQTPIIRTIFNARELAMGGKSDEGRCALGLVDQAKAWGWGVLAEIPGREIIFGGVTQPWLPNPVFRALPPNEFAAFREPGFVKIAWTLRADPIDGVRSVAHTETRAETTDAFARRRFRKYWAFVFPGTWLIRRIAIRRVRVEAECLARTPIERTP
jgi:hypothetical protein